MKKRSAFFWFVVVSLTSTVVIITVAFLLFWNAIGQKDRLLVAGLFFRHFHYFFIPLALLALGYGLILDRFFNFHFLPLKQLCEATGLINSVNSSLRVNVTGSRDMNILAANINRNLDQYAALQGEVRQKIANAKAETEIEKQILASIVSELPEGVVICNAKGQILLYNNQAKTILTGLKRKTGTADFSEEEEGQFIGIGRSIFNIIDHYLLNHAIDTITDRLESKAEHTSTNFIMVDKKQKLFRVEAIPVLDVKRRYKGFILIIVNITEELENDARVISHLNTLLSNIRTRLAAIRTSAELIADYPDIAPEKLAGLQKIIHHESRLLSDIVYQSSVDFSLKIKNRWPLLPIFGSELLSAVKKRVERERSLKLSIDMGENDGYVKVDSYSIIMSLGYIILMAAEETHADRFSVRLERGEGKVDIFIRWQGVHIKTGTLEEWLGRTPQVGRERLVLTLNDVLAGHEIEIWSYQDRKHDGTAVIQLVLPLFEELEAGVNEGITVLPGERPEFYDFDLFYQARQHPKWENNLLKDLTYTVFDTETTGLDPRNGDEIISIAGVRVVNLRLLRDECFDRFVNPKRPPKKSSIAIHGIRPDALAGQPPIGDVLEVFKQFAEDSVLIAHNAAFDMCLLRMQEAETGVHITNPVLDTMLLSAVVHPAHSNHSLEGIAERLGVHIVNRHTALGDALAAAEIFLKLVALLAAQGIHSLKDAIDASKKTYLSRLKY